MDIFTTPDEIARVRLGTDFTAGTLLFPFFCINFFQFTCSKIAVNVSQGKLSRLKPGFAGEFLKFVNF